MTSEDVTVREMTLDESDLVIDYFCGAAAEFLDVMGIDPTRIPKPAAWRARLREDFARPLAERERLFVIWLSAGRGVGFSSCTEIKFGASAFMHLHVVEPDLRRQGLGVQCVRQSAAIYIEQLELKLLYSEPNAFNTAPNRTLQAAGFKYEKTHWTVPGSLNFHQPVTRWVLRGR